jgi:hypothetical protein
VRSHQHRHPTGEPSLAPERANLAAAAPARAASLHHLASRAIMQRATAAPGSLGAAELLSIQRTLGNNAAGAMLGRAPVQAKLIVSAPGDRYEREADRIADVVMRSNDEPAEPHLSPSVMPEPNTSQASEGSIAAAGDFAHQLQASRGRPLPPALRKQFEAKMDADFSGVRVHTDAAAGRLSRAIQAQAFTRGPHIFVGAGHYAPGTAAGQRLLAHELAHVVQQGAATATTASMSQLATQPKAAARASRSLAAESVSANEPGAPGGRALKFSQMAQAGAERIIQRKIEKGKLNLVGEKHSESDLRRDNEKYMLERDYEFNQRTQYWQEGDFRGRKERYGDSPNYRVLQSAAVLLQSVRVFRECVGRIIDVGDVERLKAAGVLKTVPITEMRTPYDRFKSSVEFCVSQEEEDKELTAEANDIVAFLGDDLDNIQKEGDLQDLQAGELKGALNDLSKKASEWQTWTELLLRRYNFDPKNGPQKIIESVSLERSRFMLEVAKDSPQTGVWKVGEDHMKDMKKLLSDGTDNPTLTTREEFNKQYFPAM